MIITAPPHTQAVFSPLAFHRIVDWAVEELDKQRPEALLVCGHSGLLLAGALSYHTGLHVIAVRKRGEESVSQHAEPTSARIPNPVREWVWVDDCIVRGRTLVRSVRTAMDAGLITNPVPLYALLYSEMSGFATEANKQYQDVLRLSINGIDTRGYIE